jgi:hypothetical protein
MDIIKMLASSLGHRDEGPNIALAERIATTGDKKAVEQLITGLQGKKDVQNDCIKVLYEAGERNPALIAAHFKVFLGLLTHQNNRLQWGAMAALDSITTTVPGQIYPSLPVVLQAAEHGSVITKDHAMNILIKLCGLPRYAGNAFTLLCEQLLKSPVNQLPMYAERALPVVNSRNKEAFVQAIESRLPEVDTASKKARLERVLRSVTKL